MASHLLVLFGGAGAVDVVPPVARQLVLVEDGAVGAQERRPLVAVPVVLLTNVVRLSEKSEQGQRSWVRRRLSRV